MSVGLGLVFACFSGLAFRAFICFSSDCLVLVLFAFVGLSLVSSAERLPWKTVSKTIHFVSRKTLTDSVNQLSYTSRRRGRDQ